jgi:HD superfamily phosphodiesterase
MKKYNYKNIRNIVYNIVKNACYSQDNHFTHTAWDFHILPVSKISIKLGKKLKADLEVLELAGLLHDYADIKDRDLYEEHHIH